MNIGKTSNTVIGARSQHLSCLTNLPFTIVTLYLIRRTFNVLHDNTCT